ncbi:uncharacterized protein MYCFIDRAFT_184224 [Pseudocercospora fijiensis CIRAD86]|uniref:Uncharacterized protein n=1 Tax=Pseudocercospora fijiensis (strain CIRAD86) TaxID=383855 RepID=M2ZZ79_PSEFD|nr:uncharacterized protein MYCFIDRAFT_184224 [Pseudocercospora fijiensis CIRAD86]EME77466.1 hypothetical protein MYCFIDRAFT_184224 [Pseudocercospora fijiensis CIRAD86]
MPSILGAVPFIIGLTSAVQKVQYYYDGGCSSYAVEFWPSQNGDCYNYEYGNTNSANIVWADYNSAFCSFFTQSNCQGSAHSACLGWGCTSGNCASNWGSGFKSVQCWS